MQLVITNSSEIVKLFIVGLDVTDGVVHFALEPFLVEVLLEVELDEFDNDKIIFHEHLGLFLW